MSGPLTAPRTATEYRSWWVANVLVPYGFCWCGCEKRTRLAKSPDRPKQLIFNGQPTRFLPGHGTKALAEKRRENTPKPNPSGLCMCGCGQPTPIADQTHTGLGRVKGEPMRYVPYHGQREPAEVQQRNASEYKAKWRFSTDVPYGLCWCGCGEKTTPAESTNVEGTTVRGEPHRYKHGHRIQPGIDPRVRSEYRRRWADNTDVPYGYCWCGCGQQTRLALQSVTVYGHVKGEPVCYVQGHASGYTNLKVERAICDRYETNTDVGRLATDFGIHETTVYEVLKRNSIELRGRNIPTLAQQEAICRQYLDGARAHAIGSALGFGKSTILRVLESHGITRRDRSEARRRYTCDDHFFDVIDSELKAYWLGFIAADGCVTGNSLSVGLQARDREHLERLQSGLDATNPVTSGCSTSGHPTAALFVTSQALVAGLERNGVIRRKSKTLEWPHHLDASLLRHYLRGYFDGDGWFTVGQSAYVRKSDGGRGSTLNWGIIGTDAFCADARRFLMREVNVGGRPPEPHPVSAGMSLLKYGGNLQASRIYRLLYDDASVWLPRKRDTAQPHVSFERQTRPRPDSRVLSDTDVEDIASLRENGLTYRTIADRFGVSDATVRRVLKAKREQRAPYVN